MPSSDEYGKRSDERVSMNSKPGTLMPSKHSVHCRACDSVVITEFNGNGVPIAACPHCGQILKLRQPHRPSIQRRGA